MTTIAQYFQQPDAQRILLLHIARSDANATTYRISSKPYATEAADTPASTLYSPILAGLPEFRRTLNEPWDGGASTGFGTVTLIDDEAAYTNSVPASGFAAMTLPRGSVVTVKMAAPRHLYPLADAVTLAVGRVNRLGGDSDDRRTLEIVDQTKTIAAAPITVDVTQGPLTYGEAYHITPVLVDPGTLKYSVHGDGAVQSIDDVFDDGVPVTFTATASAGTFTLALAPAGKVTANVKGAKPSISGTPTYVTSTQAIMERLIARAGITGLSTSFSLPSDTIGYHISASTTLGECLTELARGCGGYWLIDRTGTLVVAQYPVPASGGTTFDSTAILDQVTWTEWDRLHNPIRYQYKPNWSPGLQAKPAATTAVANFLAGQGEVGGVSITPAAETTYTESPIFRTFFATQTPAQTVAERLRTLYSVPRKVMECTLPYSETLSIGSTLSLTFNGTTYDGAVIAVADVFGEGPPVQRLSVLV